MAFDPLVTFVDFVAFNDTQTPGISEIFDLRVSRKWDQNTGPGLSGGFSIYRGQRLTTFKVRISLILPEDWDAWEDFISVLRPPALGDNSKALNVWHPLLAQIGVQACVIQGWDGPTEQGDTTIWTVVLDCLEWRGAPTVALTKPIAPAPKAAQPLSAGELAIVNAADEDRAKVEELLRPM